MISKKKQPDLERYIEKYLECEALLNEFFDAVDFCYDHCISQEHSLVYDDKPGYFACCGKNKLYDSASFRLAGNLLQEKREEKYKITKVDTSTPCIYHTRDKGCMLKDYKSPLCISFLCDPYKDYIKENFNINYHSKLTAKTMSEILDCRLSDSEIEIFKSGIKKAIQRVNLSKLFQTAS
jgi:hypothetical protein